MKKIDRQNILIILELNFYYSLDLHKEPNMTNRLDVLAQIDGQTMTGKDLKDKLNGMPLIKFMNHDDIHYGMQYIDNYNLDKLPFNNKGECNEGGIYVTTLDNYLDYYYNYGRCARKVDVGDLTLIKVEGNKLKCDEVWLGEKMEKNELIKQLFMEYCHDDIKNEKLNFLLNKFSQKGLDEYEIHNFLKKYVALSHITGDVIDFWLKYLELNYDTNKYDKLTLLQRWIKKIILVRKLERMIPLVSTLYYQPGAKGSYFKYKKLIN